MGEYANILKVQIFENMTIWIAKVMHCISLSIWYKYMEYHLHVNVRMTLTRAKDPI